MISICILSDVIAFIIPLGMYGLNLLVHSHFWLWIKPRQEASRGDVEIEVKPIEGPWIVQVINVNA